MLTNMDKAWVGGLIALGGQYLSTRLGWSWITPELIALIAGGAVYWVPNKSPVLPPPPPQP